MVESKDLKNKICEHLAKIDMETLTMKNLLLYSQIVGNVHNMERVDTLERFFAANFGRKFTDGGKDNG